MYTNTNSYDDEDPFYFLTNFLQKKTIKIFLTYSPPLSLSFPSFPSSLWGGAHFFLASKNGAFLCFVSLDARGTFFLATVHFPLVPASSAFAKYGGVAHESGG